jgi:ABC-type branched-subunit amino acid transport system substrate-binding protein
MGDLNDNMPGNSQLHTDEEIIETVEQFGEVEYHDTDFWLPFGAVRNIESDKAMKAANWIQRHASGQENNLIQDAKPLWNMVDQQTRETAESLAEDATMALTEMNREELEEWKQRASDNDDSVGYIGLDTSEF